MWENDEPDKFNNNFSVQLNAKKDAAETEKKQYIGNMKHTASNATPVQATDLPDEIKLPGDAVKMDAVDDLPF